MKIYMFTNDRVEYKRKTMTTPSSEIRQEDICLHFSLYKRTELTKMCSSLSAQAQLAFWQDSIKLKLNLTRNYKIIKIYVTSIRKSPLIDIFLDQSSKR